MIRLHGYWRSGIAYRTRLALAIKGIAYEQATHDLRTGAQHDPAYRALNPQGLVPADAAARAVVRGMAARAAAHPEVQPDADPA